MPIPEVALDNLTDEELNRAPRDSIQNLNTHNNEGNAQETTQLSSCVITHYISIITLHLLCNNAIASLFNKCTIHWKKNLPTQKKQRKETNTR